MTIEKSFCTLPFLSLSVHNSGDLRICCNNLTICKKDDGSALNIADNDINLVDFMNNKDHTKLRKQLLNGERPSECNRCWSVENHGGQSYRNIWNNIYQDQIDTLIKNCNEDGKLKKFDAKYIDLTFGNNCNLRCRMCNAANTKLIIPEALELGMENQNFIDSLGPMDWFNNWEQTKILYEILKTTDRINFLGGEPLINQAHHDLLEQCVSLGKSEEIILQYNTNATNIPDRLLELWSHFKLVNIGVSIDAYNKLNEYIRFPSKWTTLESNIEKIYQQKDKINLDFSLHTTFQVYNVFNYHELLDWNLNHLTKFGFRKIPFSLFVNWPKWLEPTIMPKELKEQAYQKFQNYLEKTDNVELNDDETNKLNLIKSHYEQMRTQYTDDNDYHWKNFIKYTKGMDKTRSQNIVDHVPEFAPYFR